MSIANLIRRMSREGFDDATVIREAIRAAEALENPPPAANGYVRRMGSKAKKVAFDFLCGRDGADCVECGAEHQTIWRRQGVTVADDWERNEDEPWTWPRFTIVYPTSNLEVDHRVALHLGGTNDYDNLWLLCRECHKRKTAREQSERLKRLFAAGRS